MLDTLEQDRTRILALATQILDLEMALSAFRNEKTQAQERLDSYKYPVLTLPTEIMAEIFVAFLPVYPKCPPLRGTSSPTLLTQICREWREIALATPSLWKAIQLTLPDDEPEMSTRRFELSDVWLARSHCSPLSFQIHGKGVQADAFRTLAPHCSRVESLDVRLDLSLTSIEAPMPLLRHLKVHLRYTPARDVFVCHEAPLLRTAILNDMAAVHVVLPWGQLTTLTLERVFPDECDTVLRRVPNVVHCELWIVSDAAGHGAFAEISLLRLESLLMHDYDDEPTTGFLAAFMTPALRRLQIAESILGPNPTDGLRGFISKSGCRLQEIAITGHISVHKVLVEYRRAFPAIPKLSLHGWYSGGDSEGEEVFESDNLEMDDP